MKQIPFALFACAGLLFVSCRRDTEIRSVEAPQVLTSTPGDLVLKELTWQEPEIETEILIETGYTNLPEVQTEAVAAAQNYLDDLLAEGWVLRTEHRRRSGAEFTLRRNVVDDLKVNVSAELRGSAEGKKGLVVIHNELSHRIPNRDAPGFEPPDVPRYPGSTRLRWMNILGEWTGKYLVLDDLEKIRQFYLDTLSSQGWIYKGLQAGKLHFERGGVASGEAITPDDVDVTDPLGNIAKMIPSTLNIILADEEGISAIGFGRSAGAGDKTDVSTRSEPFRLVAERTVNPAFVVTRIDPEADLPWYPGATNRKDAEEWFSLKGPEMYIMDYDVPREQVQEERVDIGTFFRDMMPRKGWTLVSEDRWGDGTRLAFRRGAVRADVRVQNTGARFIDNANVPASAISLLPVKIELRYPVPSRDIAGEDIPDVPRFPDSKRFYFLKVAMDHVVKYKVPGTADQVYAWYVEQLPKQGWNLAGSDQESLMFTPSGGPASGIEAFGSGEWVPTILGIRARDEGFGVVDIGIDLSKGDL